MKDREGLKPAITSDIGIGRQQNRSLILEHLNPAQTPSRSVVGVVPTVTREKNHAVGFRQTLPPYFLARPPQRAWGYFRTDRGRGASGVSFSHTRNNDATGFRLVKDLTKD